VTWEDRPILEAVEAMAQAVAADVAGRMDPPGRADGTDVWMNPAQAGAEYGAHPWALGVLVEVARGRG
jgi:hypothetical protein